MVSRSSSITQVMRVKALCTFVNKAVSATASAMSESVGGPVAVTATASETSGASTAGGGEGGVVSLDRLGDGAGADLAGAS